MTPILPYCCHHTTSITVVQPQAATVASVLSAVREKLQLQVQQDEVNGASPGASPLQLRLLSLQGSRLSELLAGDTKLQRSAGSVYDRDALLTKNWHQRREGGQRLLLEAVPQVQRCLWYQLYY
jgi:hypothetical protein